MKIKFSFWTVLVVTVIVAILSGLLFLYLFGETVYDYNITLPENQNSVKLANFSYKSGPKFANREYFENIKKSFIDQKANFIEADLSSMELILYKNGAESIKVPILSKGREGSWWETPSGLYKAEGKEKSHFSSFGEVYMPWSIPFQGNFFIHGWPYYPDGTPVRDGYSGGCIRLSESDAKKLYKNVNTGIPILVFEGEGKSDNLMYSTKSPEISANSFLVADLRSHFIFTEQNPDQEKSIASITKLMTALVATEYINIEQHIYISQNDLIETSKPRLTSEKSYSLYSLLYPLLMESSNEAGRAIATSISWANFIDLMNKKAKAIGMENTKFVDGSGREGGNVSTATDLFQLAKYLYTNRSFILKITKGEVDMPSVYGYPSFSNLENYNGFKDYDNFIGGKTGKSSTAKETMLSIFEINTETGKRPIMIAVLESENSVNDTEKLINYIQSNYSIQSESQLVNSKNSSIKNNSLKDEDVLLSY